MVRHVLQLRAWRPAARASSVTVRTAAANVPGKRTWPWPWSPCSRRGIRAPQSFGRLAHHRRHHAKSSEACSTRCTAPRRRRSAALSPHAAPMCHLHANPPTIVPEIRASGQRSSCGHTCGMRPPGAAALPRSKRTSSWFVVHAASCMAPLHQTKRRAPRLFRMSGKKICPQWRVEREQTRCFGPTSLALVHPQQGPPPAA